MTDIRDSEKAGRYITKAEQRRLQSLINRTAKYSSAYYETQSDLNEMTTKIFGHAASDIDCDWIIDGVFGGAGYAAGMTVEDYVKWMNIDGDTDFKITRTEPNP